MRARYERKVRQVRCGRGAKVEAEKKKAKEKKEK